MSSANYGKKFDNWIEKSFFISLLQVRDRCNKDNKGDMLYSVSGYYFAVNPMNVETNVNKVIKHVKQAF